MNNDVRYSEFLFLREVEKNPLAYINFNDPNHQQVFGLGQVWLIEMAMALLEDLYIRPEQDTVERLVRDMRRETHRNAGIARAELSGLLVSQNLQFRITYRGLCRIEELRDLLKRDRILEPFGVLLDIRYFRIELADALRRQSEIAVSVLCLDMDNFKRINDEFGHSAGDIVMKAYFEIVRDCLGTFGTAFRGRGDETYALIIGQGHERAVDFAETIRRSVEELRREHAGNGLPQVTASIGVATTPPGPRSMEIESLADDRQGRAKKEGRNRVISS
jgi:diguanylate cyclase (GGDEF)-like protein